ncbi:hypothetical protein [Phenylobacterium sp.]|uniref:hypothetical protein n=1 Tax=Phenylobacterium sp. TaxID=1871053 RepID=UPI002737AD69|nr:hypothetical protein [Phenylobacterium sp.]MDP3869909.1 hypothetical protein [Phenylobacterium sp.]
MMKLPSKLMRRLGWAPRRDLIFVRALRDQWQSLATEHAETISRLHRENAEDRQAARLMSITREDGGRLIQGVVKY